MSYDCWLSAFVVADAGTPSLTSFISARTAGACWTSSTTWMPCLIAAPTNGKPCSTGVRAAMIGPTAAVYGAKKSGSAP